MSDVMLYSGHQLSDQLKGRAVVRVGMNLDMVRKADVGALVFQAA